MTLQFILLILTLTGVVGIGLIGWGLFVTANYDDANGLLLISCGVLICVLTAALTQGVLL